MRARLIEERKKIGLSQEVMAGLLNISTRYYKHIEKGTRGGNFDLWDRLEDVTGVHQRILRENQ